MTKRLKTPALDADRERRGRCYFSADLIFVDDAIDDEFSQKVPGEIRQFITKKSPELAKLDIDLKLTSKKSPITINIEVGMTERMTEDPQSIRTALVDLVRDLQNNFLFSFDGAPYFDERLKTLFGDLFSLPVPTIEDTNSAIGRRFVLQQALTTQREIERRLVVFKELKAKVEAKKDMDAVVKTHYVAQYESLIETFGQQLQTSLADPNKVLLQELGLFDPTRYLAELPEVIIDEDFSAEDVAPNLEKGWWDQVGDDFEILSPPRCKTQLEILLHPVMLAALKRTVPEPYNAEPPLMVLSEVFDDPKQIETLVREARGILRRINEKKPLRINQIKMAMSVLISAINVMASKEEGILKESDWRDPIGLEINGFRNKELVAQLPQSVLFLRHLVTKEKSLDDAEWIALALKDGAAEEYEAGYFGRDSHWGRIGSKSKSKKIPEIGQVFNYEFIDESGENIRHLLYEENGQLKVPTVKLPTQKSPATLTRFIDEYDHIGVGVELQTAADSTEKFFLYEDRLEPIQINGSYVRGYTRYPHASGLYHLKMDGGKSVLASRVNEEESYKFKPVLIGDEPVSKVRDGIQLYIKGSWERIFSTELKNGGSFLALWDGSKFEPLLLDGERLTSVGEYDRMAVLVSGKKSIRQLYQVSTSQEESVIAFLEESSPPQFQSMQVCGEQVKKFNAGGSLIFGKKGKTEKQNFYKLKLKNDKEIITLEHEGQRYQLHYKSAPVLSWEDRSDSDLIRTLHTSMGVHLVSYDLSQEIFCPDPRVNLVKQDIKFEIPENNPKGNKPKGRWGRQDKPSPPQELIGSDGMGLCVYPASAQKEKLTQVFLQARPAEFSWELIDEKGNIKPGKALSDVSFKHLA